MSAEAPIDSITLEEAAESLHLTVEDVRGLVAAGELERCAEAPDARVTRMSLLIYLGKRVGVAIDRAGAPRAGAGEVLGAMGANALLVAWALCGFVEAFSWRDHKPIFPLPVFAVGWILAVGLAAWLASRRRDLGSVNGVGTTIYGRRRTEHGDVGTARLVFGGLPLVPLRSYVILERAEEKGDVVFRKRNYVLRALPRIHWPQALPLLALGWAVVAGVLAMCARR